MSADAGATVTILDGTTAIGTAVVQPNGSWSSPVTLSNGSNSLTAAVSDAAGNSATSSAVVYTLSTTGPTVTEALTIDTGTLVERPHHLERCADRHRARQHRGALHHRRQRHRHHRDG